MPCFAHGFMGLRASSARWWRGNPSEPRKVRVRRQALAQALYPLPFAAGSRPHAFEAPRGQYRETVPASGVPVLHLDPRHFFKTGQQGGGRLSRAHPTPQRAGRSSSSHASQGETVPIPAPVLFQSKAGRDNLRTKGQAGAEAVELRQKMIYSLVSASAMSALSRRFRSADLCQRVTTRTRVDAFLQRAS